jgi:hypothetical protein
MFGANCNIANELSEYEMKLQMWATSLCKTNVMNCSLCLSLALIDSCGFKAKQHQNGGNFSYVTEVHIPTLLETIN